MPVSLWVSLSIRVRASSALTPNANRTRQQDAQATGRAVQVPTQRVTASKPITQVQRSGVAANRDFGGDGVPLGGSGK